MKKFTLNKLVGATIIIGVIFILLNVDATLACEIEFKIPNQKQDIFKVGDEIIFELAVKFTHRVCPEGIKNTKYDTQGIKIQKATKWKETSPGIWVRKLKTIVTGHEKGKLMISATRICDKEGGFGSITLKSEPLMKVTLPAEDTLETKDKTNDI